MNNNGNMHWASVWGNAISISTNHVASYAKNITLRYPVFTRFGGSAMKLTFDNYCGLEDVTLTKVTVLICGKFLKVKFSGNESVTIPAGENVVSDALECNIEADSEFAVSIYFGDYTHMRSGVAAKGPLSKALYAIGDMTETEDISIDISREISMFYFLSNISVYTSKENRTVICYGDSITAQDWPDYLTLRCGDEGFKNTAIIRRAASGTRILREYNCITYESYGLMGTKRFEHEVPTEGADTVIIQQGINDIIHPVGTDVNPFRPMSDLPTVEEMIEGLKYYIEKARSYGYKIYVGTLLPIEGWRTYAPFRDELRTAYNDWIRTTDLIDGCIDFDKAVWDENNHRAFDKKYNSGDSLHPSKEGYKAMANAVPAEILK